MKRRSKIIAAAILFLLPMPMRAAERTGVPKQLRQAKLAQCDAAFESLEHEEPYADGPGRDQLVNAWAECWKRGMNGALDERLLRLKIADPPEFEKEMEIQTRFNRGVEATCGKDCGPDGTMKGLPYNFCRAGAYKYRAEQALNLNAARLALPTAGDWQLEKDRRGSNEAPAFAPFAAELCELPGSVWAGGAPPEDCAANVEKEVEGLRFTRDVCDLS